MSIEYRVIPEPNVPGLSYLVTLEPDLDSKPQDFDCFTPSQVEAWHSDKWGFVTMTVTPQVACTKLYQCAFSLGGLVYGQFGPHDFRDLASYERDETLADLVSEVQVSLRDSLPGLISDLTQVKVALSLLADRQAGRRIGRQAGRQADK